MSLRIGGAEFETFVQTLGFKTQWIEETVDHPDDTQIIEYEGLVLRLFRRQLPGRKPSVMIVMAETKPQLAVALVLRLYSDFGQSVDQSTPLELMELAARRFGVELTIGDCSDRFFLQRTIPVSGAGPADVVRLAARPQGHELHGTTFLRVSSGPPQTVSCAFVFYLDVSLYRAYLGRWSR